jgi:molybdenum cofactor cytidylyltransferase
LRVEQRHIDMLAVARAIAGGNLLVSAAFTGRANLYATASGLVVYDAAALDAVNAVDESITVALLPPYAPIAPRQMAATVKIIPFAAPRGALDAVLDRVATAAPFLRVAPFQPVRAALIQTRLPGTKPSVLVKTVEATRARLVALGGSLAADEIVAHENGAVAAALARAAPSILCHR